MARSLRDSNNRSVSIRAGDSEALVRIDEAFLLHHKVADSSVEAIDILNTYSVYASSPVEFWKWVDRHGKPGYRNIYLVKDEE